MNKQLTQMIIVSSSAIVILIGGIYGCTSCRKVPAGYVGVKVYLLGGAKGVDSEKLGVGRHFIGFNEAIGPKNSDNSYSRMEIDKNKCSNCGACLEQADCPGDAIVED